MDFRWSPSSGGGEAAPIRSLYFEHEGGRAIRRGSLKALAQAGSENWQLYDLAADPAESKDLSVERPADLKSLQEFWQVWASSNGVLPLDTRNWDQRTREPKGWMKQ